MKNRIAQITSVFYVTMMFTLNSQQTGLNIDKNFKTRDSNDQ